MTKRLGSAAIVIGAFIVGILLVLIGVFILAESTGFLSSVSPTLKSPSNPDFAPAIFIIVMGFVVIVIGIILGKNDP